MKIVIFMSDFVADKCQWNQNKFMVYIPTNGKIEN